MFTALVMWLVVAVSGPLAAFLAGYLFNANRAAQLGILAAALMAIQVIVRSNPQVITWSAAGAVAGVVTAWVHLYRSEIRQPD